MVMSKIILYSLGGLLLSTLGILGIAFCVDLIKLGYPLIANILLFGIIGVVIGIGAALNE